MSDSATFILRLIDKVSGPSKNAEKALGRFRDAAGKLREANGRFVGSGAGGGGGKGGGGLGGIGDFVKGNLIAGAIEKGLELMKDFAVETARATGELVAFGQNSRFAFDQLAKRGATGPKLFEHARDLAVRFGLDVEQTTHQYANFLKLQFNPKEADKMVRMGADLRALGASAEDVQGVFLALGQIKGKGRFQGEEMLQLAERGVSTVLVQEEIGRALGGKSTVEVQKLQQQGKISADVALGAIESAIKRKLQETELGDAGARFADKTLSGMLGRFKALGTDTGVSLVEKMAAPLTGLASQGLDRLQGFIDSPQGAQTVDRIATALGKAAEFAGDFIGAFGSGFGDTFKAIGASIGPVIGTFAGGEGRSASDTLKSIGTHVGELAAFALGAGAAFVALGAGVVADIDLVVSAVGRGADWVIGKVGDVILWWDNLGAKIDAMGPTFGDKALGIGKAIIDGLVNGITSFASLAWDAVGGLASGLVDRIKGKLGIHSPSTVFADIGMYTGQGFALGIGQSEGLVASAGVGLAEAHLGAFASTTSGASSFGPAMYGPPASSLGYGFDTMQAPRSASALPPITVEVHVEAGRDAEETGEIVGTAVERRLEAWFRRLEMET
jgi:tape measure domain-containing protein